MCSRRRMGKGNNTLIILMVVRTFSPRIGRRHTAGGDIHQGQEDQTGHTLRMRGAAQRTHTRARYIPLGSRGMGHTHDLRGLTAIEARPTFNKIQQSALLKEKFKIKGHVLKENEENYNFFLLRLKLEFYKLYQTLLQLLLSKLNKGRNNFIICWPFENKHFMQIRTIFVILSFKFRE